MVRDNSAWSIVVWQQHLGWQSILEATCLVVSTPQTEHVTDAAGTVTGANCKQHVCVADCHDHSEKQLTRTKLTQRQAQTIVTTTCCNRRL